MCGAVASLLKDDMDLSQETIEKLMASVDSSHKRKQTTGGSTQHLTEEQPGRDLSTIGLVIHWVIEYFLRLYFPCANFRQILLYEF